MKFFSAFVLTLFIFGGLTFAIQNQTFVYFFYGNGCPHCGNAEVFIEQMEYKYPDLKIEKFEIYENRQNLIIFYNFINEYNLSKEEAGVPALFIGDSYLMGDVPIINGFESKILDNRNAGSLNNSIITNPTGDIPSTKDWDIPLLTIAGAALVDSINPCAFAVLLILLGTLLTSNDKEKALKGGFAFTISIYIAYFLFGLGILSALQISGLSYWFYKLTGFFAIFIGLLNIKDYFWYGSEGL